MNLLEIGKIVRVHGVLGAVKIVSYIDYNFKNLNHVIIGSKKVNAQIKSVKSLNNDAFSVTFDIMPNIDTAQKFVNQSVYIDRTEYPAFENKVYLSDLINKKVIDESGKEIGYMVDFDDYGASVILTIKCGFNSYQIPYVDEFIKYDKHLDAFIIDEQKFKDVRIWK